MSDIRTKLLFGTTIASVSLMLVMAVSLGAVQINEPEANTSLVVMGHWTVMAVNPDGTTSYSQSDNVVTAAGKNLAGDRLFDAASGQGVFNCIQLGNGTNDNTEATINAALTDTAALCDGTGVGADAAQNGVGDPQVTTLEVTITITGTDCPFTCTLTEAALGDSVAMTNVFAHTALDSSVVVNDGADVTVTYIVSTGA